MKGKAFLLGVLIMGMAPWGYSRGNDSIVTELNAVYRDGQVFLTWNEKDTPPSTTFNVYLHDTTITSEHLGAATLVGRHLCAHSARDWWKDPASFDKDATPGAPVGFIIEPNATPLDPTKGLFVHTVLEGEGRRMYFAVVVVDPNGKEDRRLKQGENTLNDPVIGSVAKPQAIWQGAGRQFARGLGKNKSLILGLHARGGGVTAPSDNEQNYLFFGDSTLGWREGLPFKFLLRMDAASVKLYPNDRAWTGGRPQTEAHDPRNDCPAVNTWWYGYNAKFQISAMEPKTVLNNYTERMVLALLHWAQDYLDTDRAATYITGGSMGGSGAVAMCLHYPNEFAAAVCEVPMVRFVTKPIRTLNRLEAVCGPIDETIKTPEGTRVIDYVDGVWQAEHNLATFPYLFLIHGRSDGSIPWQNNPPFYRAMANAKQGFTAYWNDGDHNSASRTVPGDVKRWWRNLTRYRLDSSFPVLSDATDNKKPGNGDPADGDRIGWTNRGLDWKDVVDTADRYEITVMVHHPDVVYPISADVTIRRLQAFEVKPNQHVMVTVGSEKTRTVEADRNGLVTISDVTIANRNGVRIKLR